MYVYVIVLCDAPGCCHLLCSILLCASVMPFSSLHLFGGGLAIFVEVLLSFSSLVKHLIKSCEGSGIQEIDRYSYL